MDEERKNQMEETRKSIYGEMAVLNKLIQPYRLFQNNDLKDYCFFLLRRRLDRLPIRAYFVRKNYEYVRYYMSERNLLELSLIHI